MRRRKKTPPARRSMPANKIKNSLFTSGLNSWESFLVTLVDGGAACLNNNRSFLSQTNSARRWEKLELTVRLRGQHNKVNSPVIIRLRWVDNYGNFMSPALTMFVPAKSLTHDTWTELKARTSNAPTGTTKVDIRFDAPLSGLNTAVVIGGVELRTV